MLTQSLINLTAAIRILSAKLGKFGKLVSIEKLVHVRGRVYNAVYKFAAKGKGKITRCAHFLSVSQFEADFQESRQQNAQALTVAQHPQDNWAYNVTNTKKKSKYVVGTRHPYLTCTCADYAQQRRRNFQKHDIICKHGYAVLQFLGYQTFEDYFKGYKGPDDTTIDAMIEEQYRAWEDARACLGF